MKFKKRLSLLLVLVLVATALVGCGSDDKDTSSDGATSDIDSEQYFNFALDAEPSTMDPSKGSDIYSWKILQNIMEPLTRLEEDENQEMELKPAGAKEWEVSDDGLVWTFDLVENKWSDGEPVTAHNYEFGAKRSVNPETASPFAFLMTSIENADEIIEGDLDPDELGVKALDDNTLEITLKHPTPYFDQLTYQRVLFAQREDIVEEHGDTFGSEPDTLVYNGPFTLETWSHNSEIVLEKNEDYWDADSVKMDTVNYKILTDQNARHNSLANGSIDQAETNETEWLEQFKEDENLDHIQVDKPAVNFIIYNTEDDVFKNENIRKAFSLGIDREDIVDVIHNGVNNPAYGWVPPSVLIGEDDYREGVDQPLKAIADENPDPKELLVKGLEEEGMDTDVENLDVTFSLGGTDQWFRTLGEYIQQMYKETLGVEVTVEQLEWPVFDSNVNNGDFQMGYMGWTADFNDPATMMTLLRSDAASIKTSWENERYDELVKEADKEEDHGKRLEYYAEAEEILLEESPITPVVFGLSNTFRYKYVNNVGVTEFGTQGSKYGFTDGR